MAPGRLGSVASAEQFELTRLSDACLSIERRIIELKAIHHRAIHRSAIERQACNTPPQTCLLEWR